MRRLPWRALGILTVAALLQTAWVPLFFPDPGRPNLVLLVVAAMAFLGPLEEGVWWAFGGGVLLDLFSGGPFGGSVLALLGVAGLAHGLSRPVFRGRLAMPALAAMAGTALAEGIRGILLAVLQYPVDLGGALGQIILPGALWNGLAMLVLYPALRALRPPPDRPVWRSG